MIRKTMLMASVAVAAIALAVPTVASAQWTHGTVEVKTNPNISFAGPLSFTGSLGGTSCNQTTASAQLTGGQIFGHVTSLAVDSPQGCTTSGGLAFCTLTEATFETTQPAAWTIYTITTDIEITTPEFQTHYHGAFCPAKTIKLEANSLTVTVAEGELHAVKQVKPSGTLTGTNPGGGHLGSVTLQGAWSVTPPGTYGIT